MVLSTDKSDLFFNVDEQTEPGVLGKVTLLESTFDAKSRSEIRKLELSIGSKSKIVWHFLFAGWADYSKPEGSDRQALLELIKLSASKSSLENPRIVHCSAGVGRTGTFIALDHLLCELESGHLLDVTDPEIDPVFETVNQMREQRMMMAAGASDRDLDNVIAASAEGYAFPTNLDRDQPIDGTAPQTQADLVRRAVSEEWTAEAFGDALDAQAARTRPNRG